MAESRTTADLIEREREAHQRAAWGDAYAQLSAADEVAPLEIDDLERLAMAGLVDVDVDTVTWDMPFGSAAEFWDLIASSNPIGAQLTANLTDEQAAAVRQVLDGMLRERSGGEPGAVLHAEANIGLGTK